MPKKKRKARKEPKNIDFFTPIDLSIIGSNNDPCFGKLYDLSTKECKICGDNARCAIVTSQKLNTKRAKIEKENRFKDIEVAKKDEIMDFIKSKISKGKLSKFKIIKLCNKKFGEDKKLYRAMYKKIMTNG